VKFLIKLILFIFLTSIFSGNAFSQGERYVWKKMKKKNTIKSYTAYISQFPTGKYKEKAARKQWKLIKRRDRKQKRALKKHQKEIQSKETLKMMKKARKSSEKNNRNKSNNFFYKLFRKKR